MANLFENALIGLQKKLEDELEQMKASLTEEEKTELEEKQKQYEELGKNLANAVLGLFGGGTEETPEEPKKEYKKPETKIEKKPFDGFKDVVSTTPDKAEVKNKPVKDKPIQMVYFRDEDIHESLASKVRSDVNKKTVDNDDKLYKSLCKDIDCALLNGEYKILDNRSVIIEIHNNDLYRSLNSNVINSVVDHYVTDEDFKSVQITLQNERRLDGESNLLATLTF